MSSSMLFFKEMSERQAKAGNQECSGKLANLQIDPWDMLKNFCFHVYDQKSLFICEYDNEFFWPPTAPLPVSLEFIELVPR